MTSVVDRRRFLLTSLAGVLAPLAAEAQQARKVARVGVMALTPTPELVEAARQGLRDHGWIEGQNITIDYRYAGGREDLFPEFAAEFVRLKVDVIVAVTDTAVHAARKATNTIPIEWRRSLILRPPGSWQPSPAQVETSRGCRCLG
jgi:putative ABC transport system substrate-binding protein